MSWSTFAQARSTAAAEAVWRCYADPASWPAWDEGIEAVRLEGPFVSGATGTLRPTGGPTLAFRIVRCEEARLFENVTPVPHRLLPLASIAFTHELSPLADGGCEITHRVRIAGLFGALFARLMGPAFEKGLPETVRSLAAHAALPPRSAHAA